MIKVLFFGIQSENHLWEYDFITKVVLPQNIDKKCHFLSLQDIRNTENKFDVFVYFGRDPNNYPWGYIPTYDEVLECVLKTNPKIVIQLSDEFVYEDLQDHNKIGNYCELFLRHYHHEKYFYTDNTIHIPLGYKNGFNFEGRQIKKIENRKYNWSFFGIKKSDREELVNFFSGIENGKYNLRDESSTEFLSSDELLDYFFDSIFIPCSRGWSTINTMRLYEASICGSIPVVVVSDEERKIAFKYEENPPWIFANDWNEASIICKKLLENKDLLQNIQDNILNWWDNRISSIKNKVDKCLGFYTLKNLPKVNCISLEECEDRRNILRESFKRYGINEINFLISKRYPENNYILEGEYVDQYKNMDISHMRGIDCAASHIRIINNWIKEYPKEDIGFFCEDDLSLETVKYWNFTWDEFLNNLPEDWECIQLFLISDHFKVESLELIERMWNFWGATAYIMKKTYAEKLIKAYYNDGKYTFNLVNNTPNTCYWSDEYEAVPLYHKQPYVENILFTGLGKVYNCPLFVENININSTFTEGQKFGHYESQDSILKSWINHYKNNLTLKFMSED